MPRLRKGPSPEEPVYELRRIAIQDNGEPLVELLEYSDRLYWVPRHPVFDYQRFRLARKTVAEMLARAAERLPAGLRLGIVEGWRPPEVQRQMYAATRERLSREHPDWAPRQLQRKLNRFSAPMDPKVPPPHTTGGAVDVHLCDAEGRPMDFTSPYGLLDATASWAEVRGLSPEAQRNRELLRAVMGAVGFTNYPAEWWHWSYGDPGWAYRGGHPAAVYGAIEPPDLENADLTFKPYEKPGW